MFTQEAHVIYSEFKFFGLFREMIFLFNTKATKRSLKNMPKTQLSFRAFATKQLNKSFGGLI